MLHGHVQIRFGLTIVPLFQRSGDKRVVLAQLCQHLNALVGLVALPKFFGFLYAFERLFKLSSGHVAGEGSNVGFGAFGIDEDSLLDIMECFLILS